MLVCTAQNCCLAASASSFSDGYFLLSVLSPALFGVQATLRPLPRVVARFLGLLENDRMALDQCGNYVRVSQSVQHEGTIVIPPHADLSHV